MGRSGGGREDKGTAGSLRVTEKAKAGRRRSRYGPDDLVMTVPASRRTVRTMALATGGSERRTTAGVAHRAQRRVAGGAASGSLSRIGGLSHDGRWSERSLPKPALGDSLHCLSTPVAETLPRALTVRHGQPCTAMGRQRYGSERFSQLAVPLWSAYDVRACMEDAGGSVLCSDEGDISDHSRRQSDGRDTMRYTYCISCRPSDSASPGAKTGVWADAGLDGRLTSQAFPRFA